MSLSDVLYTYFVSFLLSDDLAPALSDTEHVDSFVAVPGTALQDERLTSNFAWPFGPWKKQEWHVALDVTIT